MKRSMKGQSLAAVFLLSCLVFNYPLLYLFNVSSTVLGIPVLFLYLFAVWAFVIALIASIVER